MMSSSKKTLAKFASLMLTLGMVASAHPVLAAGDCTKVRGTESVVNNGDGTLSGTLTHGGRLNGTTHVVVTSAFTPTPDPNTFSFTDDFTLTTRKGVLVSHNVTLLDMANGLVTAIGQIDSSASTGEFAGASGVVFINGTTEDGGATIQTRLTGEVCFAP